MNSDTSEKSKSLPKRSYHYKSKQLLKTKSPSLKPSSPISEENPTKKNRKRSTFYVEDILDKQQFKNSCKYLVKWKGFPLEEATWEPRANLTNAKLMVKNFELKLKLKSVEMNKKENCEKLKAHKKADNSFFNKMDTGSNYSENETNILGNSQMMFKNNAVMAKESEKEGDFRLGDKPRRILFAKKTKNGILFAVDWEERKNGICPEISFYDNSQLKIYSPQVLIDFYEENIKLKENELLNF